MDVQIAARGPYLELMRLDWETPLGSWNGPHLVRMARGASRHLVRFVELDGSVYAVKEIEDRLAKREYETLREMRDAGLPVVEPVCTVTARRSRTGKAVRGALVTRYLPFALPYSYLLAQEGSSEHHRRLVDAAAALLVQLHLEGYWWGDCSLANTLFRRDAGALAAYLVDSETAEHHEVLSGGQRRTDLEIAVENIVGGVSDLIAARRVDPRVEPVGVADRFASRYGELWKELTGEEELEAGETWRLEERVRRLNRLGFDAAELYLRSSPAGDRVRIRPSVVEEGHHARRFASLTGVVVQENQARRLLNDLASYKAALELREGRALPDAIAAHRWLTERFEPFVDAIPAQLRARLEPAEAYHQYLDHRWFLSEAARHDVDEDVARASFFDTVLQGRPDEQVVLPDLTGEVEMATPEESAPAQQ